MLIEWYVIIMASITERPWRGGGDGREAWPGRYAGSGVAIAVPRGGGDGITDPCRYQMPDDVMSR